MTDMEPPAPARVASRTGPHRFRRSHPSILKWALAASAAFHVLLLLLYQSFFIGVSRQEARGPAAAEGRIQGIKIVRIVELPGSPDPDVVTSPEEEVELPRIQVEPIRGDVRGERGLEPSSVNPSGPAAERLRPRAEDLRLWGPVDPALAEVSDLERARLGIEARLGAYNDSIAAFEGAAARALDWTTTDAQGNRWGVSPGRLHLGKFSIPIPNVIGLGVSQTQLQQLADRQWEWQEINRGAAAGAVRASWKERGEAIRERKDRERAEKADTIPQRR